MIGQDAQSRPSKERYGTYNTSGEDRAEIAVQVKAPDWNGVSFDGRPFSAMPDWLVHCIKRFVILPHTRRHTDYAEWDVPTPNGNVSAEPGDWIIRHENGALSVVRERDAFILINLRPPVLDHNPETEA